MEIKAGSTFNGKGGEKVTIESIEECTGTAAIAVEYPDGDRDRFLIVIDPEWDRMVEWGSLTAAAS